MPWGVKTCDLKPTRRVRFIESVFGFIQPIEFARLIGRRSINRISIKRIPRHQPLGRHIIGNLGMGHEGHHPEKEEKQAIHSDNV